ncbi:hypothetical protein CCACVL1_09332 [Corchorus capsularis]|uniref:Uncharacterized protein n=1 Tax=Corchorus capsularis TaxID=210143 RepID=A0A1R3IWU4_COCAP|nr:hypothetical protein CCACVL1_09332 [Corchorus capsularis]
MARPTNASLAPSKCGKGRGTCFGFFKTEKGSVSWKPPNPGFYIINTNGAFKANANIALAGASQVKHTNTASTKIDTTLQEGKQQPAASRPARKLGDC